MSTILFAGGGTGGHIFPNLAICERMLASVPASVSQGSTDGGTDAPSPLFAVSSRSLDAEICDKAGVPYVGVAAKPWSSKPWHWPGFIASLMAGRRQVEEIIEKYGVSAVVATGGYVSGPAVMAAHRRGVPVALVNLDAVPGKANRKLASLATTVFTAYDTEALPGATLVGLPLRYCALGPDDPREARTQLGLDGERDTLMVTGGSQGAESVNRTVIELISRPDVRRAMENWQVLHITGPGKEHEVADAYARMGMPAAVLAFCDTMGLAWRAATVAVSRSGAGAVAEAWANAVPTVFLPYPHHKDDHQRLNALALTQLGGAILVRDLIDPKANAAQLAGQIQALIRHPAKRQAIIDALTQNRPNDGATVIAQWLMDHIESAAA